MNGKHHLPAAYSGGAHSARPEVESVAFVVQPKPTLGQQEPPNLHRYTSKPAGRGQRDDLDPWNETGCTQHVQTPDVGEPPSLPLACDLGRQDGQARLLRWQALHRYAAPTVELHDGEFEVRYQPMLGAYEELAALANAEQQCCSFVKWSVAEVAGRPVLRVIAPPTAPEAVEPIAALFKATRSSRKLSQ